VRLLGSPAERARFGDSAKIAKLVEFHEVGSRLRHARRLGQKLLPELCDAAPQIAIGSAYLSYPNYILEV
jgi:hypothetical protein